MMYCRDLGFIPASAIFVQKVCRMEYYELVIVSPVCMVSPPEVQQTFFLLCVERRLDLGIGHIVLPEIQRQDRVFNQIQVRCLLSRFFVSHYITAAPD